MISYKPFNTVQYVVIFGHTPPSLLSTSLLQIALALYYHYSAVLTCISGSPFPMPLHVLLCSHLSFPALDAFSLKLARKTPARRGVRRTFIFGPTKGNTGSAFKKKFISSEHRRLYPKSTSNGAFRTTRNSVTYERPLPSLLQVDFTISHEDISLPSTVAYLSGNPLVICRSRRRTLLWDIQLSLDPVSSVACMPYHWAFLAECIVML